MSDRFAIISDIHSNLEALTAVLDDIDRRGIPTIYCLGDIVGYGPDPEACIDLIRKRCARAIRGNHDDALFNGARHFNSFARAAIRFTHDRLRPGLLRGRQTSDRWEWLRDLPPSFRLGRDLFVHGSPRDPINEYVYQEDVFFNADVKLKEIFEETERATFCGHTHLPVVISSDLKAFAPHEEGGQLEFREDLKYIVNVGSVGQPRDRDPRSCYVEMNGSILAYRRVAYDIARVQEKINRVPLLDEILGTRLAKGM